MSFLLSSTGLSSRIQENMWKFLKTQLTSFSHLLCTYLADISNRARFFLEVLSFPPPSPFSVFFPFCEATEVRQHLRGPKAGSMCSGHLETQGCGFLQTALLFGDGSLGASRDHPAKACSKSMGESEAHRKRRARAQGIQGKESPCFQALKRTVPSLELLVCK